MSYVPERQHVYAPAMLSLHDGIGVSCVASEIQPSVETKDTSEDGKEILSSSGQDKDKKKVLGRPTPQQVYVRRPDIWRLAKLICKHVDLSLSRYVENAIAQWNSQVMGELSTDTRNEILKALNNE